MKWLKRIFIVLALLYLLLCAVLYFLQEKFIFNPDKLPGSYQFRAGEEVDIEVAKNTKLNCLWFKETPADGVILYLHGNKGSLRRCIGQAMGMAGNNYDILMPDYRGFGKSDGSIFSENQVYEDIQKVYDFLKQHYAEDKIVVVGYSLGTGMASYLAANNNPQRLYLLAPYVSITDMKSRFFPFVPNFLLKYRLDNEAHLRQVNCPITLFHGTNDELIPFNSSEVLKSLNPEKINLLPLNGAGHRGTIFSDLFHETVSTDLNSN